MRRRIRALPFLLLLLSPCWLFAQVDPAAQVSEEEVERQTRFIEANREMLLGNYEKAGEMLEGLLEKEPDNAALAFALARVSSQLERYERATAYAQLAIEEDPGNAWYRAFLAEVHQQRGDDKAAARVYADLVKDFPDVEDHYLKWAFYLVRSGDIDGAIRAYERLEKQVGVSEEVIRRKHALYLGLGENDKAAAELMRLVDAFPNATEYRHMLAVFYEETGAPEKAEAVYRDILTLDPNDPEALLAVAGTANPATDDMQYLDGLRPVFAKADVALDLKIKQLIPIVEKVAETGDRALGDAALDLTGLLNDVHPRSAKVHATAGDLYFFTDRIPEAIDEYETTLTLDDTVFAVWEQLLNAYERAGRYDDLKDRAEEAMDFFPNKPVAYIQYGRASLRQNDPEAALDAFEQALLMSAADPALNFQVQAQLGPVYHMLEDYGKSDAAFEGALELQPGNPEVQRAYAACLADRNASLDRAAALAEAALAERPQSAGFLDTYGWVLYKQQKFKDAERYLEEAVQRSENADPLILEHFGDLNFQLGRQEKAIQYWILALEKGGDSPLLEKKINDKQLYE